MTLSRPARPRKAFLLAVAFTALTLAACGNQLPHAEIVAAAGGNGTTSDGGADDAGAPDLNGADTTVGGGVASGSAQQGGAASTGGTGNAVAGTRAGGTTGGGTSSGTSTGSSTVKSTILLGNVGGYSGPVGASTASAQTMLKVWEAYTNDHGGLNGHPVHVISADDQSDPSKSQALVRDMVENKHVVAFVGNQMALTASAPRAYLEHKQVPAVGGDLTSVWHQSPMYFAEGSTLRTVVLGLARTAADAGKKKLGMLYCAEAATCQEIHDMLFNNNGAGAKAQGIDAAYSRKISLAQPDFTSECISARSANVDALSVVADVGTTNRVASSCARQGYHPTFVNTGNTVNGPQETNPNLDGMLATQQWFPWAMNSGAGLVYQQALHRYAPNMPSTAGTASIWASGQLLARALRNVGPGRVTSHMILESLWTLKNETLGGLVPPLTFQRDKPTQAAPCYFAMKIIRQKWTALSGAKLICLR